MSFADQMVAKLEALLLANPGASSITIDGRTMTYDDLTKQYEIWKNKAARISGSRPIIAQIKTGDPS